MRARVARRRWGVLVALGVAGVLAAPAAARAQGATQLKQAIFPRLDLGSGALGLRDEEGRPLHLVGFEWRRWAPGGPRTYVALAVASTERGVGPGHGCGAARVTAPGGVLVAVVRLEPARTVIITTRRKKRRTRLPARLKVVAHDSRTLVLGCAAEGAIDAITLDRGAYTLSDRVSGFAVRTRTTRPDGTRREGLVLYRLLPGDLRVVLEAEAVVGDRERAEPLVLAPARPRKTTKGFYDLVLRAAGPVADPGAAPAPGAATAPATAAATGAAAEAAPAAAPAPGAGAGAAPGARPTPRPSSVRYRWDGARYVER